MGIAQWWASLWRRKSAAPSRGGTTLQVFGASVGPRKGTDELLRGYRTAPWMRSIYGRIGFEFAAALRWELWDRDLDDPDRQRIYSDPILSWLKNPSSEFPALAFWILVDTIKSITGVSYILLDCDDFGQPVPGGSLPLPSHWVIGTPTREHPFYRLSLRDASGSLMEVPAQFVLPLKYYDPADPFGPGVGFAESLADEHDIDELASKHTKSFFQSGGAPSAIVGIAGADQSALDQAQERWNGKFRGNAGQTLFTDGTISHTRLDTSFKDLGLVELRRSIRDIIVSGNGCPPEIFGIVENSNRASIEAADYLFMKGAIRPRIALLCAELQFRLVPRFRGPLRYLSYANPVPEDAAAIRNTVAIYPPAFTHGELRALAGHSPGPRKDEPLQAGTSIATPENLPAGKGGDPAWAADPLWPVRSGPKRD